MTGRLEVGRHGLLAEAAEFEVTGSLAESSPDALPRRPRNHPERVVRAAGASRGPLDQPPSGSRSATIRTSFARLGMETPLSVGRLQDRPRHLGGDQDADLAVRPAQSRAAGRRVRRGRVQRPSLRGAARSWPPRSPRARTRAAASDPGRAVPRPGRGPRRRRPPRRSRSARARLRGHPGHRSRRRGDRRSSFEHEQGGGLGIPRRRTRIARPRRSWRPVPRAPVGSGLGGRTLSDSVMQMAASMLAVSTWSLAVASDPEGHPRGGGPRCGSGVPRCRRPARGSSGRASSAFESTFGLLELGESLLHEGEELDVEATAIRGHRHHDAPFSRWAKSRASPRGGGIVEPRVVAPAADDDDRDLVPGGGGIGELQPGPAHGFSIESERTFDASPSSSLTGRAPVVSKNPIGTDSRPRWRTNSEKAIFWLDGFHFVEKPVSARDPPGSCGRGWSSRRHRASPGPGIVGPRWPVRPVPPDGGSRRASSRRHRDRDWCPARTSRRASRSARDGPVDRLSGPAARGPIRSQRASDASPAAVREPRGSSAFLYPHLRPRSGPGGSDSPHEIDESRGDLQSGGMGVRDPLHRVLGDRLVDIAARRRDVVPAAASGEKRPTSRASSASASVAISLGKAAPDHESHGDRIGAVRRVRRHPLESPRAVRGTGRARRLRGAQRTRAVRPVG